MDRPAVFFFLMYLVGWVLFYLVEVGHRVATGDPVVMCAVNNEMDIGAIRLILLSRRLSGHCLCGFQKQDQNHSAKKHRDGYI